MNNDIQTVVTGGVLALLILREVFAFLKVRRENGSAHETVALLKSIREDTQRIRDNGHTLLNTLAAGKGATDLLLERLEHLDRRERL